MDLPGVGPRLRERLKEHYGDEVQHARARQFDVSRDEFLATDEAVRIYSLIISRLAEFAHTDYARLKIGTLFPSSSRELIEENRIVASRSLQAARLMAGQGIEEQLRSLRPLRERAPSRIRERALVASNPEDFQRLKSCGLDRLIDLHLAESPQELLALAQSYSLISLVGEGIGDAEGVERAESLEEWYLVPEARRGILRKSG